MTLIMKNCAFVHIPKTGGMWVRQVIGESPDIPVFCNVRVVLDLQTTEGQGNTQHNVPLNRIENKPIFCFVRNPITWYRSYWAHKGYKAAWSGSNSFDKGVHSDNFSEYIDKVLTYEGYTKQLFDFYTQHATRVGLFENLASDLVSILTEFEEDCENLNWTQSPVNVSSEEWKQKALYSEKQLCAIIESDKEVFLKYGYPTDLRYYNDYLLSHL